MMWVVFVLWMRSSCALCLFQGTLFVSNYCDICTTRSNWCITCRVFLLCCQAAFPVCKLCELLKYVEKFRYNGFWMFDILQILTYGLYISHQFTGDRIPYLFCWCPISIRNVSTTTDFAHTVLSCATLRSSKRIWWQTFVAQCGPVQEIWHHKKVMSKNKELSAMA